MERIDVVEGPFVKKYFLRLAQPSPKDTSADLERLVRALSEVCHLEFDVPLSVAARVPALLRQSGFEVTVTVSFTGTARIIDVEPGDTSGRCFGLAVDLGTTNVVGVLLDLVSGEMLGELSEANPQIAHGEDILNRIHFCLKSGNLEELQRHAAGCINSIARRLSDAAGIDAADIDCISVSGNTTMAHMFLGLDPYNICRAPYVPVANHFGFFRAAELGLEVNPESVIYVLPNVGSYVGGDVLAGVLVSGMHEKSDISLMVDVGTNAEIVIGNADWLLVCAGAAGPALEGGVVKHGMRAMPGAIERVAIDPASLKPSYSVIGGQGVRPKGMCGSALIDLLAELFLKGLIDGRGKFVEPLKPGVRETTDGHREYVLVPASQSDTGEDIVFTEADIDNLVRTKAAMYTALNVVTRELGVSFHDLSGFGIAGTFGAYIAADKAVAIGMVPDIDLSKYSLLGNSSLKGACRTLLSWEAINEIERIASMITYKELNVSTDFMSEFRAAMFLPHTDASLFPNIP